MEDACSALDLLSGWRVIHLADSVLVPRIHPAVAPINDTQFAIIGGIGSDVNGDIEAMGDVVMFTTGSDSAELRVKNIHGLLQVYSDGNQAACVGDETVVVLGSDDQDATSKVIEYKFGSRMLKLLGKV